uniref:Phage protein n=1 Tax=Globodera pallida TaxID=36090 RepID=A0A183C4I4_GLOPA
MSEKTKKLQNFLSLEELAENVRCTSMTAWTIPAPRPYIHDYADDFDYADEYWHEHIDRYDDPYQCHCRRHH